MGYRREPSLGTTIVWAILTLIAVTVLGLGTAWWIYDTQLSDGVADLAEFIGFVE